MSFSLFQTRLQADTPQHTFYFVRHGQTDGNIMGGLCPANNDFPLTPNGEAEAVRAGNYFVHDGIRVDAVYTSPLQRAHDTARAIADSTQAPLFVLPDLTERNWGVLGTATWQDVNAQLSRLSFEERYAYVPEGGESWADMETRLFKTLDDIANDYDAASTIVIVMHNGCLRAVLSALAKNKSGHEEYSVATGSITKFAFNNAAFDFVDLPA
jgi:probable phosphoglycerate mutase